MPIKPQSCEPRKYRIEELMKYFVALFNAQILKEIEEIDLELVTPQ